MSLRGFAIGDRILGQSADSHADWCAVYGQLGVYRVVGASAIGKLHIHEMRPRDDAFAVHSSGVWLAAAVSDGLGSRKQSRYGASFAVEALCEHMLRGVVGIAASPDQQAGIASVKADNNNNSTHIGSIAQQGSPTSKTRSSNWLCVFESPSLVTPLDKDTTAFGTLAWYWQPPEDDISDNERRQRQTQSMETTISQFQLDKHVHRAFQYTREGLEQFAQTRGVLLDELHCTLLGLLLNTDTGAVAVGHIGDGLVAAFHSGLGAQPLIEAPTPGGTGDTYVLTQSDWEKYLAVRFLSPKEAEGITIFYLMTDGIEDDCTHPPPEDVFQKWSRDIDREVRKEASLPQTATRLLRWLATYDVKGSWDDRTLVIVFKCTP